MIVFGVSLVVLDRRDVEVDVDVDVWALLALAYLLLELLEWASLRPMVEAGE